MHRGPWWKWIVTEASLDFNRGRVKLGSFAGRVGDSPKGGPEMTTFLPKEVQDGLDAARKQALLKKSRLKVIAGKDSFPILRMWDTGFTLDADVAPQLRGLVDVYDGTRHLYQCLIVASDEEGGEMSFEFKRATEAHDRPPLDFAQDEDAPVALIGRAE